MVGFCYHTLFRRPLRISASAAKTLPVFIRRRKFTSGSCSLRTMAGKTPPRVAIMPAQKRETKKNFIAILSKTVEEQCAVVRSAQPDQPTPHSLLGRLAAALTRDLDARRPPR
jgi:hypothetical protein